MQRDFAYLSPTPEGLALAGVILAKRHPDGAFDIQGREKDIHAQLQAAYGKTVTPYAMCYIARGCELLANVSDEELRQSAYPFHPSPYAKTTSGNDYSDLVKGLMMFALTGLNAMENLPEGKARLLRMQASLHPDRLLKAYGLPTWEALAKDDGGASRYNPNEPRIPAGQPGGGQWTTGGGVSSDSGSISVEDLRTALSENFDNYDPSALPQATQVADSGQTMTDASGDADSSKADIKQITLGVQAGSLGAITSPYPVNGADGQPVNQVNIFVGGYLDGTFQPVQASSILKTTIGFNYYFGWGQDKQIGDFIDNLPEGTTVNLIGHSYGADTAAKLAIDYPDAINTLITVDPVSHSAPNFNDVKSSVSSWININATGNPGTSGLFSDIFNGNDAAALGGHWGDGPKGIASTYIALPQNHADFTNMMLTRLPNGKTPQGVLNGN